MRKEMENERGIITLEEDPLVMLKIVLVSFYNRFTEGKEDRKEMLERFSSEVWDMCCFYYKKESLKKSNEMMKID